MIGIINLINGFACKLRLEDEDADAFLSENLADMTGEFEQESGVEVKGK